MRKVGESNALSDQRESKGLIICLDSETEIMPRFERGVLGSSPGRGIGIRSQGSGVNVTITRAIDF
jgi:hypothetical protein